jgi:hypothetical protein
VARGFCVASYDMLGQGQSDKPRLFIEQSDQVEVLRDLIASLGRPPTVAVCDQRYVFNPVATGDLDPNASCPPGIEPRLVSIVETQLPAVSAPANSPPGSPAPRVPQIGTFCTRKPADLGQA